MELIRHFGLQIANSVEKNPFKCGPYVFFAVQPTPFLSCAAIAEPRSSNRHAVALFQLEGSLQLGFEVGMSVGVAEADAHGILNALRLEDYASLAYGSRSRHQRCSRLCPQWSWRPAERGS